jgi:hypothetical protein
VLAPELLEGGGVGGEAGLGPLRRRQAELVEQDGPELGRGVDPELDPGLVLDALLELDRLGGQPLVALR